MNGIHFNINKQKWEAVIHTSGLRIHVGTFTTEAEAIIAKTDYLNRMNASEPDYDLLSKDPKAWTAKSREIISMLSKRKEASRI